MNAILTNYPLSANFSRRLAAIVTPDAIVLNLSALRGRGTIGLMRHLRSQRVKTLFIPTEDANDASVLPVLKFIAQCVRADARYIVDSSLRSTPVSFVDGVTGLCGLTIASCAAQLAVWRAKRRVRALLRMERGSVHKPEGRRVLYVNANLWFGVKAGGSVGHVSGVVNGLLEEGHSVDLASAGGRLMISDAAGLTPLLPPRHFGLPPEFNHYRFHFGVVRQLSTLSRGRRFDFIYQRQSVANFSGVELSRRLGLPLVIEYNGSESWIAKNWGRPLREQALAERTEEVNLKHAHVIVTISDVLKQELLRRGVDDERIVTYPNCIDPVLFAPDRFTTLDIAGLRRRYSISDDAVLVTFIGTFGPWHGAEVLAQAVSLLMDREHRRLEQEKVHFLFVGDGIKMPDVRRFIGARGTSGRVTFAGLVRQAEAPLFLAATDVAVSPHVPNADGTPFFGSPTKLFEYMVMGKAILASDLDQIGDVLSNSVRIESAEGLEEARRRTRVALLVPPADPELLAAGILRLASDKELRLTLGANARRLALERYTWQHHVRAILEGLNRACMEGTRIPLEVPAYSHRSAE